MRVCLFTFVLLALGAASTYSDTILKWNGGTGNWSTAANWTPPVVPNNSGTSTYAVSVGSGGTDVVTLDISPTIDSLTIGAVAGTSTVQHAMPPAPVASLAVSNDMMINKTGNVEFGGGPRVSLTVGGTLTNAGTMNVYPGSVSAGNVVNSGMMLLEAEPIVGTTFSVTGKLTNSGFLQLGFGLTSGPPGPLTTIGNLSNNGTFFVNDTQMTLTNQPLGITNIAAGSDLEVTGSSIKAGSGSAFTNLTEVAGKLSFDVSPQTIVINPQNTSRTLSIASSGSLNFFDGQNWTVGNVTNIGSVLTGSDQRSQGPNVLNVASTLTNGGTMSFSDPGRFSTGDSLDVGGVTSGTPVAGFHEASNGILDELVFSATSYGTISVAGPASLSGTLDVLLENGFTPSVGESFTILTFAPGKLSGAFDRVLNPYFAVTYDNAGGRVVLTEEAVPEPAAWLLILLGLAALQSCRARRHGKYFNASRRLSEAAAHGFSSTQC